MFKNELRPICEDGILHYHKEYQKCAYTFPNGRKCVAFAITHNEHCYGEIKAAGNFDHSGYPVDLNSTIERIEDLFLEAYTKLYSSQTRDFKVQSRRQVTKLREDHLAGPLMAASDVWKKIKSNKTCLTCLQSVPDHVLPCGHVYCEECVKEFGHLSAHYECAVVMSHCILCRASFREGFTQLVKLKPRCAGVRILTLDGGGVRGVIEIAVLQRLEHQMGLNLHVREIFDLIMGTSTGKSPYRIFVPSLVAGSARVDPSMASLQHHFLVHVYLHVVQMRTSRFPVSLR